MPEEISELKKRWEDTILAETVDRYPERRDRFETTSGIPIERIYTPDDVPVD